MGKPADIINQEIIEDTYGIKVNIIENPITNKPFIIHVNI
jgi:ABC-type cobalamin/Fe3+-siderophores transport system ATPase subunit